MNLRSAILILLLLPGMLRAQWQEDFSDRNLTTNPTWKGDTAFWDASTGSLKSKGPTSINRISLYSSVPHYDSAEWCFYGEMLFATSSNNYLEFVLGSFNDSFTDGFVVRLGGTNDDICL